MTEYMPVPHALALEGRWLLPDLAARWAPHALLQGTWNRQPCRCCCWPARHAVLRLLLPLLTQSNGTAGLHDICTTCCCPRRALVTESLNCRILANGGSS